jgi:hypothetical protein
MKSLLILCFIFFLSPLFSQENNPENPTSGFMKNALYGTAGIDFGEFYTTFLVNYERVVYTVPSSFIQSINLRIGAGPWVWWSGNGMNYVSVISLMTGRKKVHAEIGAGLVFSYDSDQDRFHPLIRDRYAAGNLGFRYQKPGGSFVFRTGIGWPEFLYLSLGFCF